jgi:hypothetical protein
MTKTACILKPTPHVHRPKLILLMPLQTFLNLQSIKETPSLLLQNKGVKHDRSLDLTKVFEKKGNFLLVFVVIVVAFDDREELFELNQAGLVFVAGGHHHLHLLDVLREPQTDHYFVQL